MRKLTMSLYVSAALSAAVLFSPLQSPDSSNAAKAATSASPAAYVYVTSLPKNASAHEIVGYVAASNGSLSAIPGSPFAEDVQSMAVNGKYLMAASHEGTSIDAFAIESNGALRYAASTDYAQYNTGSTSNDCGSAGDVFFDHTGTWLYVMEYDGSDACSNNIYASFKVSKTNGSLTYLGLADTGTFPGVFGKAYSLENNTFAYSADNSDCMYYEFYGFKRASNGNLATMGNIAKNSPTPPSGTRAFIESFAVTDPTNHLAVAVQPANPPGCTSGPMQLATYTADASTGEVSTTSTAKNMPVSSVFSIYDMRMDPTGKVLAVAGQEGLQLFHFNGASPITHYTGLLTTDPIQEMFWDNNNHLYAISQTSGKLFVYTITPTTYEAAPGSPHTISAPNNLIVQPLPL
jgi:hypothetical protein